MSRSPLARPAHSEENCLSANSTSPARVFQRLAVSATWLAMSAACCAANTTAAASSPATRMNATISKHAAPAEASAAIVWNGLAFDTVRSLSLSDAQAARLYAMVNVALYEVRKSVV